MATGTLALASPAADEFARQLAPFGLTPGINQAIYDEMGPASALLNRSSMAHRRHGGATIVMSAAGPQPGCRMILVGEPDATLLDKVSAELITGTNGWRAVFSASEVRGSVTKRMFLRRTAAGKPMLLNLVGLSGLPGKVQLFTTIVEVPAGLTLPPGF